MSEVDVKAYLVNEDFRFAYIEQYWRQKWEQSHCISDFDQWQYHLSRYRYFIEFRKAVLACLDIQQSGTSD